MIYESQSQKFIFGNLYASIRTLRESSYVSDTFYYGYIDMFSSKHSPSSEFDPAMNLTLL